MYDETYPIIEKSDSEDAIIEAHEFAQLSVRAASEMKAEELVANRRATSLDDVDALLIEHWNSISAHS